MKFRLTNNDRDKLSSGFVDMANLILGGLTVGQFISGQPFNAILFISGVILSTLIYFLAILVNPNKS